MLSDDDRRNFERWAGAAVPEGACFPNKRQVRIAVEIPAADPQLFRWIRWAQRNVHAEIRSGLINTGGGMVKARTWYLYRGFIPAASFIEVLVHGRPLEMKEAA